MLDRTNTGCVQGCLILRIVLEVCQYKFNDKGRFLFQNGTEKVYLIQFTLFVADDTYISCLHESDYKTFLKPNANVRVHD